MSDEEHVRDISIGTMFEVLDEVRKKTKRLSLVTSEPLEAELDKQVYDLAEVVADLVYLVREHLSCHDCKVVDHTHRQEETEVSRVLDNTVERT